MIFHLATQSLIYEGIKDPASTYETNMLGLVYLLESLRNLPHTGVVVVTSDKCYEPSEEVHIETSRLGGNEPYSVSKAAVEMIVNAYRQDHSFEHSLATARVWKCDRQWGCFKKPSYSGLGALSKGTSGLLTTKTYGILRPFQHVLEPLMGYLILGQHLQDSRNGRGLGFWTSKSLQVQDIICLCEQYQKGKQQKMMLSDTSFLEQNHLHIDSSKSKRELVWQNKLTAEQMINWTLEGYFCSETSKIEDICRRQIRDYWNIYFSE